LVYLAVVTSVDLVLAHKLNLLGELADGKALLVQNSVECGGKCAYLVSSVYR
jgi:hypothetical protein